MEPYTLYLRVQYCSSMIMIWCILWGLRVSLIFSWGVLSAAPMLHFFVKWQQRASLQGSSFFRTKLRCYMEFSKLNQSAFLEQ